jgi:TRAP-type C4-dicarboxylate transport system substrate-binding protein
LNLGSANCPVVVNTDALNALSDSNRQALLGSVDEAITFYVDNYNNNATKKYKQAVKEAGLVSVTFSPAQTAELDQLATSVRAAWIKKYADQFDSKALYDFTEDLFNQ